MLTVGLGALVTIPPPEDRGYVEAVVDEPPLFNPILAPFTLAGQDVLPLVFAGLVRADAVGNLAPDLAESWDVDSAGRVYTFRLRAGLTWHDDRPLDADDVAFTIGLIQARDHQGSQELAALWRGVAVEAVDARTVRFRLPEPLASFPEHLTLGVVPRHALEGVPPGALPLHAFNRGPIGSGPYRVAAFDADRVVLERHPGYHGPAPRLDRMELRFFGERRQAVEALLGGQVDGLGHLRADEADRVAESARMIVYSVPERSKVATLSLNVQTPLFAERRVRLALARAIDREALIVRALAGQAEPALGPIPVQSWAYARIPGASDYDPIAAKALLDEAGWVNGPDGIRRRAGRPLGFTALTVDSPERVSVAQELARQLRQVGFDVQVRALPSDELTEDYLERREFEAAVIGQWSMGSDPDLYSQWHSSQTAPVGGNYAGFSDPDVDRWLELGRQEPRLEDRRNAYLHFQTRWAEEQPSTVLYHPLHSFAVSRDIAGVTAEPLPDSSWRLREAVGWQRSTPPTLRHQTRTLAIEWLAAIDDRLSVRATYEQARATALGWLDFWWPAERAR